MKKIVVFSLCLALSIVNAQELSTQRVLFLLDASGSMDANWDGENKMEIAKQTLLQLMDSLHTHYPNYELGLRVFGHQSAKSLNDCKDTKLEIPFNSTVSYKEKINALQAKGHTPIAYSLLQSAKDFPDTILPNSIILITDGIENCDGNPCEASKWLNEQRISINPYIIGLNVEDSLVQNFNCIGKFINAKNKQELKQVLQKTVEQVTTNTSLSINLLTIENQIITNTPISLYDPIQSKFISTYIHSITKDGLSDTLYIDPRGVYQVVVYTTPPLLSQSFYPEQGKHNVINLEIPKGILDFDYTKLYDEHMAHFILNNNGSYIYNNQVDDLGILKNNYQLSINQIPLYQTNVAISANKITKEKLLKNGRLNIELSNSTLASIYKKQNNNYQLIMDLNEIKDNSQFKLQPGKYLLCYIDAKSKDADQTHIYNFEIFEDRTTVVSLK